MAHTETGVINAVNVLRYTPLKLSRKANFLDTGFESSQGVQSRDQAESALYLSVLRAKVGYLNSQVDEFLSTINCDSTRSANFRALNSEEYELLVSQARKISALQEMFDFDFASLWPPTEKPNSSINLQKLSEGLKGFDPHHLSTCNIWWKRTKLVVLVLLMMALVLTLALILFSPITCITGLGTGISVSFMAMLALFTGKAATMVMHSTLFGMPVEATVEEPTTLTPLMAIFVVPWMNRNTLARLTVSLEREQKARGNEHLMLDCYIAALSIYIKQHPGDNVKKAQLEKILDHAERIHRSAKSCVFEESYQRSERKALQLLQAVSVLAGDQYTGNIMDMRIDLSKDKSGVLSSVKEIISQHRYPLAFWKSTTHTQDDFSSLLSDPKSESDLELSSLVS